MPAIHVVNDTIIPAPSDPFSRGLTPREAQVRAAFFILGVGTPIVGALFALFVNGRWWLRKYFWSYQRLCAIWFITVSAFAIIVYALPGQATRSSITLAIIHEMLEISIIALLLGSTASQALIGAMLLGLLGFTVTFAFNDISYVYLIGVILGGTGDFLMPLLLFYGKQPVLAVGSLAHVAAALLVFTEFVHDIGIVTFNVLSFFAVWLHVGFIIAGLRILRKKGTEYPSNPMKRPVPSNVLAKLTFIAFLAGTAIAVLLTFVVPNVGH